MKEIISLCAKPALFLGIVLVLLPSSANALSTAQKQVLDEGIYYFNTDAGSSGSTCSTTSVPGTLSSNIPDAYNGLFTQAAAGNVNPNFLAAIYMSEHDNSWLPLDSTWKASGVGPVWPDGVVGARGPFQFEYGTWGGYATDGNNDGVKDPDNMFDAAYSAAKMLGSYAGTAAPLGSIDTPYKAGTILEAAAAYNWGTGNVQIHTTATSPITGDGSVPDATKNYIENVYNLITSGFTKAGGSYGDPTSQLGSGSPGTSSPATGDTSCSGGVVAGSVVQTALNLSWPGPHDPPLDAEPAYVSALRQYDPAGQVDNNGADCGVFVATVMHASQADPNYPDAGTAQQAAYVKGHPEKYDVVDQVSSTADLQPGDILIVNGPGGGGDADGHTYIYVGPQSGGYNEASASQGDRMPSLGTAVTQDSRGYYIRARLK